MNAIQSQIDNNSATAWSEALCHATDRIAPAWPLDQMIAVNPFWGFREQHISTCSAKLAAYSGVHMLAPDALYTARHAAPNEASETGRVTRSNKDTEGASLRTVAHWCDELSHGTSHPGWHTTVIDQISRFCGLASSQADTDGAVPTLYADWLRSIRPDRGLAILMGAPQLTHILSGLPDTVETLFIVAGAELDLSAEKAEAYGTALLWDINGWASRFAWVRWQARLAGNDDDSLRQLLAVRLAWELALWRLARDRDAVAAGRLHELWATQLETLEDTIALHKAVQSDAWSALQTAERHYQASLQTTLQETAANTSEAVAVQPELQAVFCIDVRSEVIRRHLEAQDPRIQTKGFAGFFGLPIALQDHQHDGSCRPQLPGLLAPALTLKAEKSIAKRQSSVQHHVNYGLHQAAESSPAIFGLVESMGLSYAFKLLKDSLNVSRKRGLEFEAGERFTLSNDDGELTTEAKADLAAGILRAMGLSENFAHWVLLTGHGSQSKNNAHAASLDCGACGGHSGEANVRILADVLNDAVVRAELAVRGIAIPEQTRFIPALHNTTTDELHCLEGDLPQGIRDWLTDASAATRAERAEALGLDDSDSSALLQQLRKRATDWSQVRPEWGLAGNAAFIAAPRALTRGKNLQGRTFLHDYSAESDPDFKVLELIMTAPMVVAHWINTQYNASVADNVKLGSGNKVLHNVVGGNVGVLEGGAGDLRIGLPMQSIHNGDQWMHCPLRLSVYIQAPKDAIADIYRRHDVVRQLIDNEWLYVFALDETATPSRLFNDTWHEVEQATPAS